MTDDTGPRYLASTTMQQKFICRIGRIDVSVTVNGYHRVTWGSNENDTGYLRYPVHYAELTDDEKAQLRAFSALRPDPHD